MFNGLSFKKDGEIYATDVSLVSKVARRLPVTPVPSAPREVIGIANLKGKVVTILNIRELLKQEGDAAKTAAPKRAKPSAHWRDRAVKTVDAIVFKSDDDDSRFGLAIDSPGNLVFIDDESISRPSGEDYDAANGQAGISRHIGAVAVSKGSLYRILDIESIVARYRS